MPGAYHFDGPNNTSGQPLNAGIFRPPISPSASSSVYNLAKSTGSLYSDISMANTPLSGAKRKRARADTKRESTPMTDWTTNMDGVTEPREDGRLSGGAQHLRYTLAGRIDTPGSGAPNAESGMLEDSVYSDVDYRRALGPKRLRDETESPAARLSSLHIDPGTPKSPGSAGWSAVALNTIGEVVGKVWEFCRAGAFRGFHAGGGRGYEFNGVTETDANRGGTRWCNEHDIPTLQTYEPTQMVNSIPGNFPQSDYMPYMADCHEMSTPETTPRPSAKRRHLEETNDELRRNWVIVKDPPPPVPGREEKKTPPVMHRAPARPGTTRSRQPPRYSTPTAASSGRRISVPVSRLSFGGAPAAAVAAATPPLPSSTRTRRASLRISHAGSPGLSARSPASFAQPRLSPTTAATLPTSPPPASRIPVPSSASAASASAAGARPGGAGGVGGAAGAAGAEDGAAAVDSPRLDAEARQLAQRKIAAERDADVRMEAFNKRLMAMIRQGKEALGTTVEVEMDCGGGWEDEEE
ncbi:hypothetical protein QBC33DRAFT_449748 [Phialemonium atrogriseum]|uniref:Uncharacterized protein n=1 Tax=Phialemonium atrogriseum TaxID=1093897 RepID=A0AAJ0FMA6_9PEZI|nr:uncharacterized protein QBC33DRAFT_449748 [Phialemonium atrogriseum]KAK1768133.1 hypothetical protein QBC33DRAFT_449748 [Phialemonium atrogriseum]